ncbi:MAG: hypothetical protein ISS72_00075 [Candidatus Brocadiae bacterium]|nr:hypothetical protein [Candidatus Brocadiia bacterium]
MHNRITMTLPWALIALLLATSPVGADSFANKKTGQTVQGRLLGTISRDGEDVFFVKTDDGRRLYLPMGQWTAKKSAAPPSPKARPTTKPSPVVYRGKERSEAWVDEQSAAFQRKLAVVDGQIVDLTDTQHFQAAVEVGDACSIRGTVVRALGKGDALVRLHQHEVPVPSRYARAFWPYTAPMVKSPKGQVVRLRERSVPSDGDVVRRIMAVGTCEVDGHTVVDCRPLRYGLPPLTREQFLLVLRVGLPLSTWERGYLLKRYRSLVLDPRKRMDPRKKPKGRGASVYLVFSTTRTHADEMHSLGLYRRVVP